VNAPSDRIATIRNIYMRIPTTKAAVENCFARSEDVTAPAALPDSKAVWHLKLNTTATIPRGRKKNAAEMAERTRCGEAAETTPKPYWIV
jgi:hypothetical protein